MWAYLLGLLRFSSLDERLVPWHLETQSSPAMRS